MRARKRLMEPVSVIRVEIQKANSYHYNLAFNLTWEVRNADRQTISLCLLGTLVNGLANVYKTVLRAVRQLSEIQVVLSVGENVKPECLRTIPSRRSASKQSFTKAMERDLQRGNSIIVRKKIFVKVLA